MNLPINPKDGGPAFPAEIEERGIEGKFIRVVSHPGMSLRDYFATQSMLVAASNLPDEDLPRDDKEITKAIAKYAYELADAMLAARKEQQP